MKSSRLAAALLAVLFANATQAQTELPDATLEDFRAWRQALEMDQIRLWNECEPLPLIVLVDPEQGAGMMLTKERIETIVRSRMRSARIYSEEYAGSLLSVDIQFSGQAAHVDFRFRERFEKEFFNYTTPTMATTWQRSMLGTHGNDEGPVLAAVSELTDIFIDEYLNANADAC